MMMFRTNSRDFFDAIQSDVFTAMELMGDQAADAWQEEISIDVEYGVNAYGQPEVVVRSLPGEPPRRETQRLWESIQATTENDDVRIITEISTDVDYGFDLEYGHGNVAARPHRDPIFEQFAEPFIDAVIEAINRPSFGGI